MTRGQLDITVSPMTRRRHAFAIQEPLFVEEARGILKRNGLSIEATARKLQVSERTMYRQLDRKRMKPLYGPIALCMRYWNDHPDLIPRA